MQDTLGNSGMLELLGFRGGADPLATTTDGQTSFSSDGLAHPEHGHIAAHEAVHRQQHQAWLAGAPAAPPTALEQEAHQGANAGPGFTAQLGAPAGLTLAYSYTETEQADLVPLKDQVWQLSQRDDPLAALQEAFRDAPGIPPTRQAMLVGLVSEYMGPDVAGQFSAWLAEPMTRERRVGMQVGRNRFGAYGPGLIVPALGASLGTLTDRAHAFISGFLEELPKQIDEEVVNGIAQQLARGGLVGAAFPPVVAAGALHGALADLADTLKMIANLGEVVGAITEMVKQLLAPGGSAVARAMGHDLAVSFGSSARELLGKNALEMAYWMGYMAGPLLSDLLLALITGGAALVAVNAYRAGKTALKGLKVAKGLKRAWGRMVDTLDELPSPMQMAEGPDHIPGRGRAPDGPDGARGSASKVDELMGRNVPDELKGGNWDAVKHLTGRPFNPDHPSFAHTRVELERFGYHVRFDEDGIPRVWRKKGGATKADGSKPDTKFYYDVDTERLEVGKFEGSNRISKPGALRKSLGDGPDGHQAHHVVPDAVVRKHPLLQQARSKAGYDLDHKGNGMYLPTEHRFRPEGVAPDPSAEALPLHRGSHPDWNQHVTEAADTMLRDLAKKHGISTRQSLDDMAQALGRSHPADLLDAVDALEKRLHKDILDPIRRDPDGRLK